MVSVDALLILSGGASRRMGQDKARLPFGHADLLHFQQERFIDAGFQVVSELSDIYGGHLGPLAGIHAALYCHPEVQNWLVVPVDMPLVSVDILKELAKHGRHQNIPVCFDDCPLPLYLPVLEGLQRLLESWLENPEGKRSVYALMKALNGQWLSKAAMDNQLSNINTPEEWHTFLQGALR